MKADYANVMTKEDERTCVMASDPVSGSEIKDWEFDKIFNGSEADGNTQEAVFKDTSLLIISAIDGFNVVSIMFVCLLVCLLPLVYNTLIIVLYCYRFFFSAFSRMDK